MFSEIPKVESPEIRDPESNGFKDIKPENGTTVKESDEYWDKTLSSKEYVDDNGVKYREGDNLVPNTKYELNGYAYETDGQGRIISAEGKLQVKDHEGRNDMKDTRETVAHGSMDEKDDSSHVIADRFNGDSSIGNLLPMDANLNRGDYKAMENKLADAVNQGANVYLKVEPVYSGDSYRPSDFKATYSIDGEKTVTVFKNGGNDNAKQ